MELERVLSKLKFDEAVSGYALITNDGQPFLSFSLPDDVLPMVQGALRIHGESFNLINVMTDRGIVILARVDSNWVLAVLFSPDLQLGVALQKTKEVVDLMGTVVLPPPPKPVSEPVVTQSAGTTGMVSEDSVLEAPSVEPGVAVETPPVEAPPLVVEVRHGCVVHQGAMFNEAMTLDATLNNELKAKFSNLGIDVLLMVNEKRTAFKIFESLGRRIEQVFEVIKWCVQKQIISIECPEEQEAGDIEIVELPLFEGDINKVKKEHRELLAMCNGERTLQDISKLLDIPYFKALQSIIHYRGKTLTFIRKGMKSVSRTEV
ncbi:MAG: hypothetical protein ACE5H4_03750 [Candidatus Thorarchaeota archaeon]